MKRILLIDDSAIQLRMMRGILQEDYEVMMATSGMEGIKIINKKKPDLIFLDYDMPMLDGKATLKMLKNSNETKDIPVVFLTGTNDKENVTEVLKLKPAGYLLKPAEPDKLFEIIHKVLGDY